MNEDFRTTVAQSAERVAAAFAAQPYRAGQPYDPRPLLAVLTAEQAILQAAVDGHDGPITANPPADHELRVMIGAISDP